MRVLVVFPMLPVENPSGPVPAVELKDEKIGHVQIWDVDWVVVIARKLLARYPGVQISIWRPSHNIKMTYVHVLDNGIEYTLFPAKRIRRPIGLKIKRMATSPAMIKAFKELEYDPERVLDIPPDYSYLGSKILKANKNKYKVIGMFHTNPELYFADYSGANAIEKLHRFLRAKMYDTHLSLFNYIIVSKRYFKLFSDVKDVKLLEKVWTGLDYEGIDGYLKDSGISEPKGRGDNEIRFFTASRIIPTKNIEQIILAFSNVQSDNKRLYIAGTGEPEYVKYLIGVAEKLNITDKVIFTGYLDKDLIEYYYTTDCFISFSNSEGGPVSALNALYLNRPVIISNTGQAAALCKKYKCGKVVEIGDVEGLTAAMQDFAENPGSIPVLQAELKELQEDFEYDRLYQYYLKALTEK